MLTRFGIFLFLFLKLNNLWAGDKEPLIKKKNFLIAGLINISQYYGGIYGKDLLSAEASQSTLYFPFKNFGFGGEISLRHIAFTLEEYTESFTQVEIGPKAAYFLDKEKVYPYLSCGLAYSNFSYGYSVFDGFNIRASIGLAIRLGSGSIILGEGGFRREEWFNYKKSKGSNVLFFRVGLGIFITPTSQK